MQVLAILQARMQSTRLPGKVLLPLAGEPMLWRQIERIRRSKRIDHLVVATSQDVSDAPIADMCSKRGADCFRGSLDDVLDRFYQAAKQRTPEHVVRLTGDCPLSDPAVIDDVANFHLSGNYDYSTNALEPTFPDGLDVEIFRFDILAEAWNKAMLNSEREHVTPFFRNHPELFKIGVFKQSTDLSGLRWTVDEPLDFTLVTQIYNALHPNNPCFTTQDILALFSRQPALKDLNARYKRNEGYAKTLYEENGKGIHGKS